MRRLLIGLMLCVPGMAWATACPTSVPSTYPGSQGSTTPTAIPSTLCTNNGVTAASIDVFWGVTVNSSVWPYVAASGGSQSTADLMWVGPHECIASPSSCFIIWYLHGGGGTTGTNGETGGGDPLYSSTPLAIVQLVQQLLGVTMPDGNTRTAFIVPNYPLAPNAGFAASASFPTQWQASKCELWYVRANQSTFPGDHTMYGVMAGSWGTDIGFWMFETTDTLYTANCPTSAPGSEPPVRASFAFPAMVAFTPSANSGWDNTTQSCQLQNAWIAQLYESGDPTITTRCTIPANYVPSGTPALLRSRCVSLNCDPGATLSSSDLALHKKNTIQYIFGSHGNGVGTSSSPGPDGITMPDWNGNGVTTGTTGGAWGGQRYTLAAEYIAAGLPLPQMQEMWSFYGAYGAKQCHECDWNAGNYGVIGGIPPSIMEQIKFISGNMRATGSSGIGGNVGGS